MVKWAKYGIHVNAIAPGWFTTEMTKWSMDHFREKMLDRILLKRFSGEDDLKGAVVFSLKGLGLCNWTYPVWGRR